MRLRTPRITPLDPGKLTPEQLSKVADIEARFRSRLGRGSGFDSPPPAPDQDDMPDDAPPSSER